MDDNGKSIRFLIKLTIWIIGTTDPKSLNFNKNTKFYIPNPVDESLDDRDYENTNPQYDLFAMSHEFRGVLKKGKFDDRENLIDKLIKKIHILNLIYLE